MTGICSFLSLYGKSPLRQLFVSLIIVMVAGSILFSVLLVAGIIIFDADLNSIQASVSGTGDHKVAFLRYILISQQVALFVVPAIIILKKMNPAGQFNLMGYYKPGINEIILLVILGLCIIPITIFTGELNSAMRLPDWLSGLERWMAEKEQYASEIEEVLLTPDTLQVLFFNLFMIAVIPAIGEELIFRGVFQKILTGLFRSGHPAIWITAFFFSSLHFQFFGFIPRFLLGLIFGYLFYWSGTLWFPVISHFVNNAVSVIIIYLQGAGNFDPVGELSIRSHLSVLPVPFVISLVILFLFYRNRKKDTVVDLSGNHTKQPV
jgi:hypothetical protein